jgi:sec-independent protein translocase protein TatB
MFGIDSAELLIIAVVALVVIGPKDLPRVMRTIGNFIGRARGMARHFRSGIDSMIREAELEDMEKQWKSNNDRIMREHPLATTDSNWGQAPESDSAVPPPAELAPPDPAGSDARPKAPPRRAGRKRPAASAPPIPAAGPGATDETP